MKATRNFFNVLIACMACVKLAMFSSCDDEKNIDFDELPDAAQQFIKRYYPNADIVHIIQDKDDGRKDYDVVLSDGTEMEFNENGEWQKVESNFSTLPSGILPAAIESDVTARFSEARIHGVERELGGFKVKIYEANGAVKELRYSASGEFVGQELDQH